MQRRPSEPWAPNAVVRLVEISGVSLIVMGVAWYGCSGTVSLSKQVLWTVLAIGAGAAAAFGQAMFVLDAIRAVKERRLAVMTDLAALLEKYEDGAVSVTSDDNAIRVAAPSMTHFHRPTCQLVAGKSTPLRAPAHEHVAAGRSACGVCAA